MRAARLFETIGRYDFTRFNSSNNHKPLDEALARLGYDRSIGLAEIKPSTAKPVEGESKGSVTIPASKDRAELIDRLLDPDQNINYAGAVLENLHEQINEIAPSGTPEQAKWNLAIVGYNVGIGGLNESFKAYGFGGLGPHGQTYFNEVIPYIPRAAGWVYGDQSNP
jgi:soluble lytic murein transglycosylase-like protein